MRVCCANHKIFGEDEVERAAFFVMRCRIRLARRCFAQPQVFLIVPGSVLLLSPFCFDVTDDMKMSAVIAVFMEQDRLRTRWPQCEYGQEQNGNNRSYDPGCRG